MAGSENHGANAGQTTGQAQLGQHPIDPVERLVDVLEKRMASSERRGERRAPASRASRLRQPPSKRPRGLAFGPRLSDSVRASSRLRSPASADSEARPSSPTARGPSPPRPSGRGTRPSPRRSTTVEQERRQVRVADVGARHARRDASQSRSGRRRSRPCPPRAKTMARERGIVGELVEGRQRAPRRRRRRGRLGSEVARRHRHRTRAARARRCRRPAAPGRPVRRAPRCRRDHRDGRGGGSTRGRWEKGSKSPISRVLCRRLATPVTVIPLGPALPPASSNLPGEVVPANRNGRDGRPALPSPYLVLLRMGFAVPRTVTGRAVRSYRTVSPLPRPKAGRSVLCCTFRRITAPRRWRACHPLESGLSSPRERGATAPGSSTAARIPPCSRLSRRGDGRCGRTGSPLDLGTHRPRCVQAPHLGARLEVIRILAHGGGVLRPCPLEVPLLLVDLPQQVAHVGILGFELERRPAASRRHAASTWVLDLDAGQREQVLARRSSFAASCSNSTPKWKSPRATMAWACSKYFRANSFDSTSRSTPVTLDPDRSIASVWLYCRRRSGSASTR